MILHFTYEELRALRSGARAVLGREVGASAAVMAPSEVVARVEALEPMLGGDVSVETLAEVRAIQIGVTAIVECLRAEMDAAVVAAFPADEGAVAAYFDYAHALGAAGQVERVAAEMEALVELVTGEPADEETARTFEFPD